MSTYIVPSPKESVIRAGTTLLTCEPFASVLNTSLAPSHCDHCFQKSDSGAKETDQLSTCGGCHLVRYCDRRCQKGGWNNGHRWECCGFKVYGRLPPQFARLLFRIITKLETTTDVYDRVSSKITRRFKDLMSHYPEIRADSTRMEHILTSGKVVESLLAHQSKIRMPNEAELVAMCGRMFVNTFSITDGELHQLGTGLYLGASIFDHSCEPMAVATFQSTTICIRSIVDYPASLPIDKVTIAYQDTLRPSGLRKPNLQSIYYFECQCVRCTKPMYDLQMTSILCPNGSDTCNYELHIDIDEQCTKCSTKLDETFIRKVKEAEEMVKAKQLEMHNVSYLDVCETCLNVMRSLNFSEIHWLMTSMASSAFDASIDMQRWEKAFTYGHLALKGYRAHLSPMHPLLGITLLKLAKLSWFMEKEDLAKSYIEESKQIIDITHGPGSRLALREVFVLAQEIKSFSNPRRM